MFRLCKLSWLNTSVLNLNVLNFNEGAIMRYGGYPWGIPMGDTHRKFPKRVTPYLTLVGGGIPVCCTLAESL